MYQRRLTRIGFVALVALLLSCANKVLSPAASPTASESHRVFLDSATGLSLTWPAGWEKHPSQDCALILLPAGAKDSSQSISLDIPKLPFHVPGLIPLGSVRNGYLDDLRKQKGKIEVQDLPAPNITDAKRDLVRSTWQDASGAKHSETALLIVRGDQVYIVRANSDDAHELAVRTAFDQVVSSLKWNGGGANASN